MKPLGKYQKARILRILESSDPDDTPEERLLTEVTAIIAQKTMSGQTTEEAIHAVHALEGIAPNPARNILLVRLVKFMEDADG